MHACATAVKPVSVSLEQHSKFAEMSPVHARATARAAALAWVGKEPRWYGCTGVPGVLECDTRSEKTLWYLAIAPMLWPLR